MYKCNFRLRVEGTVYDPAEGHGLREELLEGRVTLEPGRDNLKINPSRLFLFQTIVVPIAVLTTAVLIVVVVVVATMAVAIAMTVAMVLILVVVLITLKGHLLIELLWFAKFATNQDMVL